MIDDGIKRYLYFFFCFIKILKLKSIDLLDIELNETCRVCANKLEIERYYRQIQCIYEVSLRTLL